MDSITKEHILKAIERYNQEGLPEPSADSQYYDLLYEGKRYPPKVIVSYANYYAEGEDLDRRHFSGGIGSKSFRLLENHGFVIVDKEDNLSLDNTMDNSINISIECHS